MTDPGNAAAPDVLLTIRVPACAIHALGDTVESQVRAAEQIVMIDALERMLRDYHRQRVVRSSSRGAVPTPPARAGRSGST